MEGRNFWNETQSLLTYLDAQGFGYDKVGHESGESVRYFIEPGAANISMDRVLEVVENFWSDTSRFDHSVERLPEGPVELEVYSTQR